MFVYLVFIKVVSLKVVHPLKISLHSKFHGPTLSSASLVRTLVVWRSAILERLQLLNYNYGTEDIFSGMASLLKSIQIYQLVQKLIGGTGRHADTQDCDLISLHCTFRNMKAMIVLRIFGTRCRHVHPGNRGP